jgi:small subunit ribosomal protein S2
MSPAEANSLSPRLLLEAGAHFGHAVSRLNPKMLPYIFGERNRIHIIDIRQTIKNFLRAQSLLRNLARRGDLVLFAGTKRQARAVVQEEALRCGMPYVHERWLGGTLTNYRTVRSRLARLEEIERWEQDGMMEEFSKKERAAILREKRKLVRNLHGIRSMDRLPAALVVVDAREEAIAIHEADVIGAAVIALIDTDSDPDGVDIPIPCNDDSMKVIQYILHGLAEAVIEGRGAMPPVPAAVPEAAAAAAGDAGEEVSADARAEEEGA